MNAKNAVNPYPVYTVVKYTVQLGKSAVRGVVVGIVRSVPGVNKPYFGALPKKYLE